MSKSKTCKECGLIKPLEKYTKRKASKDGLHPYCNDCIKIRSKAYREKNIEKIRKYDVERAKTEKRKSLNAEYRKNNREILNSNARDWYHNNKDRVLRRKLERYHELYYNDTKFRVDRIIRRSVGRVIELSKTDKKESTYDTLGYKPEELIKHIQLQFQEGMSWDNYGEWHIDHIIPIIEFIKNGVTDPKIINSLENLQPLWANDNLRKGANFMLQPSNLSEH